MEPQDEPIAVVREFLNSLKWPALRDATSALASALRDSGFAGEVSQALARGVAATSEVYEVAAVVQEVFQEMQAAEKATDPREKLFHGAQALEDLFAAIDDATWAKTAGRFMPSTLAKASGLANPVRAVHQIQFAMVKDIGPEIDTLASIYLDITKNKKLPPLPIQQLVNQWINECSRLPAYSGSTSLFPTKGSDAVVRSDDIDRFGLQINVARPEIVDTTVSNGGMFVDFKLAWGLFLTQLSKDALNAEVKLEVIVRDKQTKAELARETKTVTCRNRWLYIGEIAVVLNPARTVNQITVEFGAYTAVHGGYDSWTWRTDVALPAVPSRSLALSIQPATPSIPHNGSGKLFGGTVVPEYSESARKFEYWVRWMGVNGERPVRGWLFRRGIATPDFQRTEMKLHSADSAGGALYVAEARAGCCAWPNEYYFEFESGGRRYRLPDQGYLSGPEVRCRPDIAIGTIWGLDSTTLWAGTPLAIKLELRNQGSTLIGFRDALRIVMRTNGVDVAAKEVDVQVVPGQTLESSDLTLGWTVPVVTERRDVVLSVGILPVAGEENADNNWREIRITMIPLPAELSGHVIDDMARPLKDAVVRVLEGPELASTESGWFSVPSAEVTNDEGRWMLRGIHPGTYVLEASWNGIKQVVRVQAAPGEKVGGISFQLRRDARQLTFGREIGATPDRPRFSPDGSRIVFQSVVVGGLALWIVNVDDQSPPVRLTGADRIRGPYGCDEGEEACFSPDGRWIVFTGAHPRSEGPGSSHDYGIFIASADGDGSDAKLLIPSTDQHFNPRDPTWRPDGRRIAFSANTGVWIYDRISREETLLTPLGVGELAWSPDGRYIAGEAIGGVVVLDASTGEVKWRCEGQGPSWTPDGSALVYECCYSDIQLRYLSEWDKPLPVLAHPERPERSASVSPDGRWIVFQSSAPEGRALFLAEFREEELLVREVAILSDRVVVGDERVEAAVRYELLRDAEMWWAVYDCRGNRVRRSGDAIMLNKGIHVVTWDGADDDGLLVRDGVYAVTVNHRDQDGNIGHPIHFRVGVAAEFGVGQRGVMANEGGRIAVHVDNGLAVRDADGNEVAVVPWDWDGTENGLQPGRSHGNRQMSFSPDGKVLAFEAAPIVNGGRGGTQVFRLDVDRGVVKQLTFPKDDGIGHASSWAPRWSPDGRYIACYSMHARGDRQTRYYAVNILLMDPNGGGKRLITGFDDTSLSAASGDLEWSGDGRGVLFPRDEEGAPFKDVWWAPIDGSGVIKPLVEYPYNDLMPVGIPGSRWILWRSDRQTGWTYDTWLRRLEGQGMWALWKTDGGIRLQVQESGHVVRITDGRYVRLVDALGHGRIKGRVVEAGTEVGVGGADVYVYKDGEVVGRGVTAKGGMFMVRDVAPGSYLVRASKVGYCESSYGHVAVAENETTVVPFNVYVSRCPKVRFVEWRGVPRVSTGFSVEVEPVSGKVGQVLFQVRAVEGGEWIDVVRWQGVFEGEVPVGSVLGHGEGVYELRAIAVDPDGNVADDTPPVVRFLYDTVAPESWIEPLLAGGRIVRGSHVLLTAHSEDSDAIGVRFEVLRAGNEEWGVLGMASGKGTYSLWWDTSGLERGETYAVRSVAFDGAGNVEQASVLDGVEVTIVGESNGVAPAVAFAGEPEVEVSEGAGQVTLVVERVGPVDRPARVKWAVKEETALGRWDWEYPRPEVLSWAAGEAGRKAVTVRLVDNRLAEGPESFLVFLYGPEGVELGTPAQVRVRILDDDWSRVLAMTAAGPVESPETGVSSPDITITVRYVRELGSLSAGTRVELVVTGPPGEWLSVEESQDLKEWRVVERLCVAADGMAIVRVPAGGASGAFYRLNSRGKVAR